MMNDLTALLQRGEGGVNLRQAVVSAVSGGVATVVIGTTEIKARYLKPAPSVGDTVLVTYLSNSPVVVGAFAPKTTTLSKQKAEGE
jgi:hypothetical protein